jgi:hypothetical protein
MGLQANPNSMTFVNYGQARKKGLGWVNMINRAGNLVEPNATTVGSAMNDFSDWFDSGEFNVDIYDANGSNSWPFSFISYFSISKDVQTFDCTNIQEQLNFVSWVYTNDAYVCFCLRVSCRVREIAHTVKRYYSVSEVALDEVDFVPLNVSLRKRLIDRLVSVQCNGQKAVTTPYLIGIGPALPLYTSWSVAQSGLSAKVKYYVSTSKEAKKNLATGDEDFGTTNDGLSARWLSLMNDVALMPAAAFAIAPGAYMTILRIPHNCGHCWRASG